MTSAVSRPARGPERGATVGAPRHTAPVA